jgi:4-amino-4-deoxy-L-arabinose transferase-like glycosyltransferase
MEVQFFSTTRLKLFVVPVVVCIYLLASLFTFLFVQGDSGDWVAFMHGEASMTLFFLYCIVGIIGTSLTLLFRKKLRILDAPKKVLTASFLLSILIGCGTFTYLNFTATQENYDWMHDGLLYQQMGESFLVNHEFIVDGSYTHHFAPVYPIYLAAFYAVLPVHLGTQIATELIFAISILVIFIVTRKLYGTTPALITTGLMATLPTYLLSTSRNYPEPMVLIWYVLTLYFILESLKPEKENYIILAGLCAALGFLTKSSLGYFFLITGSAGFLWRFYYMRWQVLKNKSYLTAVLVFLGLVSTWAVRNLSHFWDGTLPDLFVAWQPSQYLSDATLHTFTRDFGSFFVQFWFFIVLTSIFVLGYAWIFSDYLRATFRKIRDERISCLLLAIMLPLLIGWIIGAIFFVYENQWMPDYWIAYYPISQTRYLIYTLVRYCFIALVPLSWLAYEIAGKAAAPEQA